MPEPLPGDEESTLNLQEMMLDMANIAVWRAITEGRLTNDDDHSG